MQGRKNQRPLGDDGGGQHGQGGKPDEDARVRQESATAQVCACGENQHDGGHHCGTKHTRVPFLHCQPFSIVRKSCSHFRARPATCLDRAVTLRRATRAGTASGKWCRIRRKGHRTRFLVGPWPP